MSERLSIRSDGVGNPFNRRTRIETLREFLRGQSQGGATRAQVIFDIAIGIVLPILCLVFDPLVFRRGLHGGRPLAGEIQLFAYTFIAVQIIALAVWLGIGARAGEWCGVLSGIMRTGALFSFIIGICLLPFSFFGLIILVGALGFTPFFTGFIYQRNARRALRAAGAQMTRAALYFTLMFGGTLALATPTFAQLRIGQFVERSLAQVIEGDDSQAQAAARRLQYVGWLASAKIDQMVLAYSRATDPQRKERLARAYREITGDDIEDRSRGIFD